MERPPGRGSDRRQLARSVSKTYLLPMPHARINGIWLHYRVEGEGEPLLLLMGFGAPLQGWDGQVADFSRRYRVIRLDNRGVGRSDKPIGHYSAALLAEDARGLLDHLRIERAHVVGKSMGGMAAMELAARHPDRVRSLVLAATTPAADARLRWTMGSITARVGAAMLRAGGSLDERLHAGREEFIRIWLPVLFSAGLGGPEEALLRRLIDAAFVEGFSLTGLAGQLGACFSHDARSRLRKIHAPTLVLGGTADALFPRTAFESLAKNIEGARMELVDGGPHGLNLVAVEAFNQMVLDFLRRSAQRPTRSSMPSRAPSTTSPGASRAARS